MMAAIKRGLLWGVALLVGVSGLGMLVACSSGESAAPPSDAGTPARIVYLAPQDVAGVVDLYLVGSSRKLNPALSPGRAIVGRFAITPDQTAVVYSADQDTDEVGELYRVAFANPGVSTKLNPPLPVGRGGAFGPVFTPDGTAVVYQADQDIQHVSELYRVALANPDVSTKLNPALPAGGTVLDPVLTPDGTAVIYLAAQDTHKAFDLYRVVFANPGVSTKLNPALPADGTVIPPVLIIPDGTAVVYSADQDTDNAFELYRVALANPGVSTKLNPPLPAGRVVLHPVLTPDGTAVIYLADQDTDNVFDLYRVAVANPGVSTKLNGPLVTTGAIFSFCVNAQCVLS